MKRFLCSEIVLLSLGGRERFVNLEEIWRTGAVLDAEEENAEVGASGELRAGAASLKLSVRRIEKYEFGYRIEVEFRDGEWSPQLFTPAHLTDLAEIARKAQRPPGKPPE